MFHKKVTISLSEQSQIISGDNVLGHSSSESGTKSGLERKCRNNGGQKVVTQRAVEINIGKQ